MLIVTGIIGFVMTCVFVCATQDPNSIWTSPFSPTIIVGSFALLVLVKNLKISEVPPQLGNLLVSFQRASFGVYLIHPLVLLAVYSKISVLFDSLVLCIFMVSFAVLLISYMLACALRKVPVVDHFII